VSNAVLEPVTPPARSIGAGRLALAHEWLSARAGSEKTFEAMSAAFPTADLYALSRDPSVPFDFGGRPVVTTPLDCRWLRARREVALPLMPLAWRHTARHERYDLVVTSSHACVKGFYPGRAAFHCCYVHSPMRYAWLPEVDGRARPGIASRAGLSMLARWDRRSVGWVDALACNSRAVRDRIARFYGRDAEVIYPPVDTDFFRVDTTRERRPCALAVSRLIPYKRVSLAIEACHLAEIPLVVAGSGPERMRLAKQAAQLNAKTSFVDAPSDDELRVLYQEAAVVVFPAEEDFGIIPVEAQACGTPVVAFSKGGARDTVLDGETGSLVSEASAEAFADAIREIVVAGQDFAACRANAMRFSRSRFVAEFADWVLTVSQ
jgi:glycosyltransferase involved in cell wall biosynthesis